jgi:hypothetical protein
MLGRPTRTLSGSPAARFLLDTLDAFGPMVHESGELVDPVFGVPTQYGTAYHALCTATLLHLPGSPERLAQHTSRAARSLETALAHTADPCLPATAALFDRATGTAQRTNHRDFTWPAILRAYRLLRAAGAEVGGLRRQIADVDVLRSFRSRPPSNWSSVWISGEWLRIREGLSPHTVGDVDGWLTTILDERVDEELGFYADPHEPNSYDLFTRLHLLDLLVDGYDGLLQERLRTLLLGPGLERSLAMQLSDGSLASAYRSTGQTWTVAAQIAYLTHAAELLDDPEPADRARAGARLAFASLTRYVRQDGTLAPVENTHPPTSRIGYEYYTADAHYSLLALAFLGSAVRAGFTGDLAPSSRALPSARVEGPPTHRGVVHAGRFSAHVVAAPAPGYDGIGVNDLTVGPGRLLQFASSVRHLESGRLFTLGIGCRREPGAAAPAVLAQQALVGGRLEEVAVAEGAGIRLLGASTAGAPLVFADQGLAIDDEDGRPLPAARYALEVRATEEEVTLIESTPGLVGPKSLFVPFLLDPGHGPRTETTVDGSSLRLVLGEEELQVGVEGAVDRVVVLTYGFENRRGVCGLARLDLAEPTDTVTTVVTVVR